MSLSSRVNINDGITSVDVDGHATLSIEIQIDDAGGSENLRMGDGSIQRQVAWEKRTVIITFSGWVSPSESANWNSLIWSRQLTVTLPKQSGTRQFVGYANEPAETQNIGEEINITWILSLEEG